MIDAYNVASTRPWLMQEEWLQTLLAIANRMGDPDALQSKLGSPLENSHNVSMVDGVAVIPVTGPLFRYANIFTRISGATSTGELATDIREAMDNPYVRGIVLDINSPGGEVTGTNELAGLIARARQKKRVIAYAGGLMASAAYWTGSAAGEVWVDATARLGSIGVVMAYTDTSKRDEKSDVRHHEIVSSKSPKKRTDPTTEAGRAEVQRIVDALAEVFIGAVAQNRRVSPEKVEAEFGQGGVLVGADAVRVGMADRLGSLDEAIAVLAGRQSY